MIDGFWIVQFEGVQGGGSGVAVLQKGKVFGGESGFTYTGNYTEDSNALTAHIKVHRFAREYSMLLPVQGDDYELTVEGRFDENNVYGRGAVVGMDDIVLGLKLTRYSDL